jgi:activator of 2-hydroxyglutaryl-CoA dehydratase
MVSDAYPDGIGRISSDLTAAHLAKGSASLDDFLAGLLNMHGESIAQIAAGRAQASGVRRIVLAGGFVHDNAALADSMTAMVRLFGMQLDVTPHPGFAGAIGAALIASREGD